MFERGRGERSEGPIPVEITLEGGLRLQGKFMVAPDRKLAEVLNANTAFFEFYPLDGEQMFVAKTALHSVKPMRLSVAPELATPNGDASVFNPAAILGTARDASREQVREAYLHLAKLYHPDRYATAELPPEVREYLGAMARRINAAYDALHGTHQTKDPQQEPVFTKPGHGQ